VCRLTVRARRVRGGVGSRGRMTAVRRPEDAPARAPLALIVIALLSGSLAAGIFFGGLARGGGDAVEHAAGLRAGKLPGGLDGRPAPAFRLRDGRGGIIDTRTLRGRPYAVTFLYTRCPDVCPAIAEDLRDALRGTEATAVAVSVDPRGDTPRAVRAFAAQHRLPASFRYAIGDRAQLATVWSAYFAAPQSGARDISGHTAAVWLVDAHGRLRAMYPGGAPIDPADLAHDLRALRG
jgi:protein SCO1/2